MIIGVPREIKSDEYRVALLPVGVEELRRRGHQVLVQRSAGVGSGFPDEQYATSGAEIVSSAEEVYANAEMIIKVKEPLPPEWPLLRSGQIVFTYFHLASNHQLTQALLESGIIAVAYETLEGPDGRLPLLTPMSEVAGRMSIQEGAKYLERPQEGRGILLGGVPGVQPAHIVILGGGVVGKNAAQIAAGFQADVVILDINVDRLRYLEDIMPANVNTLFSDRHNLHQQLQRADLVIGAVLIPGAKAPQLVTAEDLKSMKPGAVLIDVAVDQGGCFETTHPTTHANPTFIVDDVVHYCVANMPGAVGRTSTHALCNVTFPYACQIADGALQKPDGLGREMQTAINMWEGKLTNRPVADALGLPHHELTAL